MKEEKIMNWEIDICYLQRMYETCRCPHEKSSIWYLIFDLQKEILYFSAFNDLDAEKAVEFLENSRPIL